MNLVAALHLVSLLLTAPYAFAQPPCKNVQSVDQFDLEVFRSKKWYSHQQIPTPVNPVEQFYCITAQYSLLDASDPNEAVALTNGYDVRVFNVAEDIDGNVFTSDDAISADGIRTPGPLCAGLVTEGRPAEFRVNFCPISISPGESNYWVLAYDETEGMALIAGGQTIIPTENGLCKYPSPFSGVWIFSRSPVRNEAMIQKYRSIAMDTNGIDLSSLADVSHENCEPKHGKKSKTPKMVKKAKKTKGE